MTKIKFENLPSTNTPINAENLNKLNNLAIDTTIEGHEEEVVLIKSDNLLPHNLAQGTWDKTGTTTQVANYSNIWLEPGTYTFTSNIDANTYQTWLGVAPTKFPHSNWDINEIRSFASFNKYTFTITTGGYFLNMFQKKDSSTITPTNLLNIQQQIVKGSDELPYEPYKTSKIYANKEKYTDTVSVGVDSNNSCLWVKYSKNLIPPSAELSATYTYNANGVYSTSSNYITIRFIPVKPNTTYTYSDNTNKTKYALLRVYEFTSSQTWIKRGDALSTTSNNVTFTTGSTTYFIAIGLYTASTASLNDISQYQVELGTKATNYENPTNPSINVNNNGSYEPVAYKNVYSTNEVVIGEFLGKPLYRKVVDFGALPNATTKDITIDISNIENYIKISGMATNGSYFLDFANATGISYYSITKTRIRIQTDSNYSSYNGFLILEYTKTTD